MNDQFLTIMAMGDAYGMRLEFVEHDCKLASGDLHYAPHPTYEEYKPAHYTDDTQKSIANAQILLRGNHRPTDDDFINAWLYAYRRDPREGYSKYMKKVLSSAENANDFRSMINPDAGVTSGGAMCAGVFGLLTNINTVKRLTIQQAKITHNTSSGINAALGVALSVHYLHHGGQREYVGAFIARHLTSEWNSAQSGRTDKPDNGLNIVSQMVDVVSRPASLSQTLLNAANYAPLTDTDTLCALSLQVASRDCATVNDLPAALQDELENKAYGRDYLVELDHKLMLEFPRRPLYENGLKSSRMTYEL